MWAALKETSKRDIGGSSVVTISWLLNILLLSTSKLLETKREKIISCFHYKTGSGFFSFIPSSLELPGGLQRRLRAFWTPQRVIATPR